jgi:hypothetical protein
MGADQHPSSMFVVGDTDRFGKTFSIQSSIIPKKTNDPGPG